MKFDVEIFLFVFSTLVLLRSVLTFVSSLLQTPPKKMDFRSGELIFNGICISYFITYLIS
jgi:hypothetical protein